MPKTKAQTQTQAKLLRRPKDGDRRRKIAGVAAALADYFGIDVVLVRLVLVLTLIPGGIPGLLIYFLAWLVIPEED